MRLTTTELEQITGLTQPAAQRRWFNNQLRATVPADGKGPIITRAAFEALVARSVGLRQDTQVGGERPRVKVAVKPL